MGKWLVLVLLSGLLMLGGCGQSADSGKTRIVFIPIASAQFSSLSIQIGSNVSACHISSWLIAVAGR